MPHIVHFVMADLKRCISIFFFSLPSQGLPRLQLRRRLARHQQVGQSSSSHQSGDGGRRGESSGGRRGRGRRGGGQSQESKGLPTYDAVVSA